MSDSPKPHGLPGWLLAKDYRMVGRHQEWQGKWRAALHSASYTPCLGATQHSTTYKKCWLSFKCLKERDFTFKKPLLLHSTALIPRGVLSMCSLLVSSGHTPLPTCLPPAHVSLSSPCLIHLLALFLDGLSSLLSLFFISYFFFHRHNTSITKAAF